MLERQRKQDKTAPLRPCQWNKRTCKQFIIIENIDLFQHSVGKKKIQTLPNWGLSILFIGLGARFLGTWVTSAKAGPTV